jgi:hypothetical protein
VILITEEMRRRATRLSGILTGLCEPAEYKDLLEADLLVRRYEGATGFMGLSTLRAGSSAEEE